MPAFQAGAGGRISPRDVGRRDPLLGTSKARVDWYPDVVRFWRRRRGKPPVSWLPCDGRVAEEGFCPPSRGVQKVGDPPDPS